MRRRFSSLALLLGPMAGLAATGDGVAQEVPTVPGFDPDRAILNDTQWFDPFRPTEYESLAQALDDDKVREDTPLLVLSRGDRLLTFVTMQMTYHHVAQGDLEGEPWMVSF